MKFFHVFSVALLVALFTSIGCSSGNYAYYTGGGVHCPDGYDPLPPNVDTLDQFNQPQNKVANFKFNDAGTYTYNGMEAYFHDLATDAGVHTKIVIDPNTQVATPTIVCTRNMTAFRNASNPSAPGGPFTTINQSVTSVRSLLADGNGNTVKFQVGSVGYTFDGSPGHAALVAIDGGAQPGTGALSDVFKAPAFNNVNVYCTGTCLPTDTTKSYQIRASYTRTPDKPPFQNNQYNVEVVTYVTWTSTPPGAPTPPPPAATTSAQKPAPTPPPPPQQFQRPPNTPSRTF